MKTKLLTLFVALIAAYGAFAETIPNDEIWYTSLEENIVAIFDSTVFNATILSNTYQNGKGIIKFDKSVITIEGSFLEEHSGLVSITMPNSIKTLGRGVFWWCSTLNTVDLGDSLTTIGEYAFGGCDNLKSVTIPNSVIEIKDNAFDGCYGLTFVTIGNSVTTIGEYAFSGCSGLTSITIPNSVTSIGDYAFQGVKNIVYYGTATGSPWGARCVNGYVDGYLVYSDASKTTLYGCSSAATGEVIIPNSVTTIGYMAFYGCSGLISVTIPNSVTTIGDYAFYYCFGLTSVTCEAMTPPICGAYCFSGVEKSIPVYVPAQSIALYKTAKGWKDFTNIQGFCDGEPYFSVQDTVVCGNSEPFVWEGDSIYYGGKIKYSEDSIDHYFYREVWSSEERIDTFTRNYISAGGCDSTLMLVVHYYPSYYEVWHLTIEEGGSIYLSMKWITETGVYYDTLRTVFGCDSIQEYRVYVKPKPTYVVTLSVNNTKYGSVEGAGIYNKGDTVILSATPNKGYQFNQWSDGNTDNPRTFIIDKDYTLTAQFGIKQCRWLVESNDLEMGAVYTDFTNEFYNYGTQITVEASANSGYKFVKWNDGKKYNPYKFSLIDDKYLLAIFMAEEEEMDTTQVQPSDTTATFTWPFIIGGFTYTLTIYLDAACTIPFCTLTFNQYGQLIGITFGARAPRRSALASQEEGFTTTINGLSANTQYYFKMETKDEDGKLINTDEGSFATRVNIPTNLFSNRNGILCTKYFHNGNLIIERNGIKYTATGQKVR